MNKQEFKEYLKQADKAAYTLSKLKGDADVIATLLSLIYTLIIRQAQYELERDEKNE